MPHLPLKTPAIGLLTATLTATLVATGIVAAPAQAATPAAPTYAVRLLPMPFASSIDVSSAGHVAGVGTPKPTSPGVTTPFVWSAGSGMTTLPVPTGATNVIVAGVNSDGWVTGTVQPASGPVQGVVWRPAGAAYEMVVLPTPAGLGAPVPVAIDDSGRIVGSAGVLGTPFRRAFLWSPTGGSVDLTTLGYPADAPVAMSRSGWVATPTSAYRLGDPASIIPLPALPSPGQMPYTLGIADDGDRFVRGLYPSSQYSAMLLRLDAQTGTWTQLWSAPVATPFNDLADVNALGDAVGFIAQTATVSWAPGDLATGLPPYLAGGYAARPGDAYPGLSFTSASGISDGRDIVANANTGNNAGRLVRLTPTTACTVGTCLRVTALTVGGTTPSTCTPGATYTASGSATVTDQFGAPARGVSVSVGLLSGSSTVYTTVVTDRKGIAKFTGKLGTCEGTVTALVDDVVRTGATFDRTVGTLVRSALPTVR